MAETNGFDGDHQPTQEEEAATSTSPALEIEAAAALTAAATTSSSPNGGPLDPEQQESEKEETGTKTVPFYKLFSFADSVDVGLMIVGTIGAVGNGLCMPFMTVLFGELINSFGQNQNNKDVIHIVSKVKEVHPPISIFLLRFFFVGELCKHGYSFPRANYSSMVTMFLSNPIEF